MVSSVVAVLVGFAVATGLGLVAGPVAAGLVAAAVAAGLVAVRARVRPLRLVAVNLALLALVLGSVELLLALGGDGRQLEPVTERSHPYVARDPVTGFAPAGPSRPWVRKLVGDEVVYDVVYSIDGAGRRRVPEPAVTPPDGAVLVFGGSFTFGEGVADEDSMPWRLAVRRPQWRVVNLGFSGWGAQQMLALVESGRLHGVVEGDRVAAVYQTGFFHVERTAGRVAWAAGTPRYRLTDSGSVERDGSYPSELEGPFGWPPPLDRWLLWRRLLGPVVPPDASDRQLHAAVVAAARRGLERRSPGSRFLVVYWDREPPWLDGPVVAALRDHGLEVLPVSSFLDPDAAAMRLDPADPHPSPRAHDLVAARVSRWLESSGSRQR